MEAKNSEGQSAAGDGGDGDRRFEFNQHRSKIENVVDEITQSTFGNQKYEATKMQKLVNQCSERIIQELQSLHPDIKLIAEAICLQKGTVAFHMGGATFWDT